MATNSAPVLSPDGGWTVSKDFRAGAGPYLNYKIGTAVRNMSRFNNAQIDHVKWLVTRNTVSISLSEDYPYKENAIDWSNMSGIIDRLFQMMIKPEDRRDTVELNSNELVLVLNSHGAWPKFDLRATTSEAVKQLQTKWNYWPVRVYAGHDIQSIKGHKGITLTLLNVVNTDLGGPSMIQLLDAKIKEPSWNRVMIRKEYRDRHFVNDYVHPDLLEWVPQEKGYAPGIEPDVPKPAAKYPVTPAAPVKKNQAPASPPPEKEEEELETFEAAETLPERPAIQHPTWKHSTASEPLVDLVGRDARAKRFTTPDSGFGEDEDDLVPAKAEIQTKKPRLSFSAEDDDFEMV